MLNLICKLKVKKKINETTSNESVKVQCSYPKITGTEPC